MFRQTQLHHKTVSLQGGQRKVISETAQTVDCEIEHITGWRVLFWSGSFTTKLRMLEDRSKGLISFKLISSDVMQDLEGCWTVKPFTQDSMDELRGATSNEPIKSFKSSPGEPISEGVLTSASVFKIKSNIFWIL